MNNTTSFQAPVTLARKYTENHIEKRSPGNEVLEFHYF